MMRARRCRSRTTAIRCVHPAGMEPFELPAHRSMPCAIFVADLPPDPPGVATHSLLRTRNRAFVPGPIHLGALQSPVSATPDAFNPHSDLSAAV
jgi:hypothetical protein